MMNDRSATIQTLDQQQRDIEAASRAASDQRARAALLLARSPGNEQAQIEIDELDAELVGYVRELERIAVAREAFAVADAPMPAEVLDSVRISGEIFDNRIVEVQKLNRHAPLPLRMDGETALTGGKLAGNHYYRVQVDHPISPELQPYAAECADIIEALGMTFNEGEAFKALWRLAAARQGRGKPGNAPQYDADKVAHYGARVAACVKRGI